MALKAFSASCTARSTAARRRSAGAAGTMAVELERLLGPEGAPLERGAYVVLELEAKALGLSLPATARLLVDRHTVVGEQAGELVETVEALAREKLPAGITTTVRQAQRPTPAPQPYLLGPYDLNLASFVSYLPPRERQPIYGRSVGDYNFLAREMPTVVYGPKGGNWHAPGEWVDLESTARVLKVYQRYLLDEGA